MEEGNIWGNTKVTVETERDTNPNTYILRAEEELKNGNYENAIFECDQAIDMSGGKSVYLLEKIKVLYAIGRYRECLKYMLSSSLWDQKQNIKNSERDLLYRYFAKAFKKNGNDISKSRILILTSDGDGMYQTIQEAVNRCRPGQKIYLTAGTYVESICMNRDIELCIEGLEKGDVIISDDNLAIEIREGKLILSGVTITKSGTEEAIGVLVHGGMLDMSSVDIKSCNRGIQVSQDGKVNANNCKVIANKDCNVYLDGKGTIRITQSEISGSMNYGIFATDYSSCYVEQTLLKDNRYAMKKEKEGMVQIQDSKELNNDPLGYILGGIGRFFS